MRRLRSPILLASLLALSFASSVASAEIERSDNPECLGSQCGRPAVATTGDGGGFLRLWADFLAFFG